MKYGLYNEEDVLKAFHLLRFCRIAGSLCRYELLWAAMRKVTSR